MLTRIDWSARGSLSCSSIFARRIPCCCCKAASAAAECKACGCRSARSGCSCSPRPCYKWPHPLRQQSTFPGPRDSCDRLSPSLARKAHAIVAMCSAFFQRREFLRRTEAAARTRAAAQGSAAERAHRRRRAAIARRGGATKPAFFPLRSLIRGKKRSARFPQNAPTQRFLPPGGQRPKESQVRRGWRRREAISPTKL